MTNLTNASVSSCVNAFRGLDFQQAPALVTILTVTIKRTQRKYIYLFAYLLPTITGFSVFSLFMRCAAVVYNTF
jgi:hypothetical protein